MGRDAWTSLAVTMGFASSLAVLWVLFDAYPAVTTFVLLFAWVWGWVFMIVREWR